MIGLLVSSSLAVGAEVPTPAVSAPRFFFAGNGHLRLRHAHLDEVLDVEYRHADGFYDTDAMKRIAHFFRSRGDGREGHMSLRLIELLAYVQRRYRPQSMTLVSGYRSPEFNESLRSSGTLAAQASLHTQGLAADIAFAGLDLRRLWLQLREERTGGVGYYRSDKFLHIDTGAPRFWEETTSRVTENLSQGNARIFARTDFDRYLELRGAEISLHSVTVLPLAISETARVSGGGLVRLEPLAADVERAGGCFVLGETTERYDFRVVAAENLGASSTRRRLILSTCAPRLERTPPEIETNEIELGLSITD